ncbi:hypothetical protein Fmac_014761 [Flemingia macrophylla]|uniref:Uncharacterized protein n=1 Tax=Flemingia macrophylla TaxID=520843 RepID=A0ABD1MCN2_9FABA
MEVSKLKMKTVTKEAMEIDNENRNEGEQFGSSKEFSKSAAHRALQRGAYSANGFTPSIFIKAANNLTTKIEGGSNLTPPAKNFKRKPNLAERFTRVKGNHNCETLGDFETDPDRFLGVTFRDHESPITLVKRLKTLNSAPQGQKWLRHREDGEEREVRGKFQQIYPIERREKVFV